MIEEPRATSIDRSANGARGGSIGMVLVVAIALVGAAVGLLLVGRGNAGPYILALLAFLATVGVFSLFAIATGILRLTGKDSAGNPILKAVVDESADFAACWSPIRAAVSSTPTPHISILPTRVTSTTFARSNVSSSATLTYRKRSIGC